MKTLRWLLIVGLLVSLGGVVYADVYTLLKSLPATVNVVAPEYITVTPAKLDFGDATPNIPTSVDFKVGNGSAKPISVTILVDSLGWGYWRASPNAFILNPEQSQVVTFEVTPFATARGQYNFRVLVSEVMYEGDGGGE